jgi:hypothetical protein
VVTAVLTQDFASDVDADTPQAPVRRASAPTSALHHHPITHAALAVKVAAGVLAPLVASLAVLAGIGSFATIRHQATPWFGSSAWIVPIGIDIGIIALLAWDLLAEYLGFPWPALRWTAWTFIAFTIYLNISAAHGHLNAIVMHAAMPMLVVTVVEGIRHLVKQWTGLTTGTRIEHIPVSRWLLSPWSSFMLGRRMVLWQVTSYRQGLAYEYRRLQTVAKLQEDYGRFCWHWKAPLRDRIALRLAWAGSATDFAGIDSTGTATALTPAVDATPGQSFDDPAEPQDAMRRLLNHLPRHCLIEPPKPAARPQNDRERQLIETAAKILDDAKVPGHPTQPSSSRQAAARRRLSSRQRPARLHLHRCIGLISTTTALSVREDTNDTA